MKYETFKHPNDLFRGTDFWMLNGELTEEEIVHQLHEMKAKGVYSFIARTYLGLKSDYPGPKFKAMMRVIIDTSKKLGLKVFLQAGYMPEAVLGLPEHCALRYIYPVKTGEEDGRRILCQHGEWSFVEHNSVTFLDMFDAEAMDYYLKASYEDMWAEFADEYGKTVLSVWVDEPSYNSSYLPWTPKLEQMFRERWGYELAEKVWMLYFDCEESPTVRYHYRVLMRDLLEKNYFGKVQTWCHSHGLLFSGHLMMEDTLQSQICRAMACMPYYRYFDIPGIDVLRANMNWVDDPIQSSDNFNVSKQYVRYNTTLQCVSAAKQAGKKHILAEMYGVGGENFTFRNMAYWFDLFAASGINHRSVHGIFYTLKGRGKRAYPPHISYYQPFWPKYNNVTDYCARVSAFISEGQSAANIAVIHPLETAYTLYRGPIGNSAAGSTELKRLDFETVDLLRALRSEHYEADFADLASIRDMGAVENGRFTVGCMSYGTVILPHLSAITSELLDMLERFAAQGGQIICFGDAPTLVDGYPNESLADRIGAISVHAETVAQVLDKLEKNGYAFCGVGSENLFIHHRVCENGDKFFVCNVDCAHEVRLRFTAERRGELYVYNAYSGEISAHPYVADGNNMIAEIVISAGGSILLSVEPPRDDVAQNRISPALEAILQINGEWNVETDCDNTLLLELCRFRKGDGEWSDILPIQVVQLLLTQQDYRGEITLQYEFDTADKLDGLTLALEDPALQTVTLDGRIVDTAPCGYFYEKAFERVALGSVPAGHHVIEIKREFYPLSKVTNALTQLFETRHGAELEPMYLLGKFAVCGHRGVSTNGCVVFERNFTLKKMQEQLLTRGELTADGFPFFVGEVTLTKEIVIPETADLSRAKLRLGTMNAGCGELWVNGTNVGDINRAPFEAAIGPALKAGVNVVQIKLYTTLYNIIGPFHRPQGNVGNTFGGGYKNPDAAWLSVDATLPDWERKLTVAYPSWSEQYNVVPLGIGNISLVF